MENREWRIENGKKDKVEVSVLALIYAKLVKANFHNSVLELWK